MDNLCGNCKHWHELPKQTCRIRQGHCNNVPNGTTFSVDGKAYKYSGWSFEDECYDDVFKCFEVRDGTERMSD